MERLELFYPLKPAMVTQKFGETKFLSIYHDNNIDIMGHNGIDFFPSQNVVRATHDGEVVYCGVDSKEGYGVVLRTLEQKYYNDGVAYFKTIYWHLFPNIPVKVGQQVKAGDIIGYPDNTGLSTGAHLHFGLKPQEKGENDWTWWNVEQKNGYLGAIDPTPYFNGYCAQDAQLVISIYQTLLGLFQKMIDLLKRGG